ncbi:hypothetical protein FisN_22Hh210 [Fistulifera solaris]|uniref:Selenoprotein H n=1 Tax=Fistulifera solaris TaxID=1519565 RepID=A0A1Z5JPI8_FISSO|nr:hypothetical protein FisN_22Hh210 [Fistulifera solaris]|eukprot:GAX15940.1 hypothetical protein FisN_22Hh210 [Fistulifera solaris]
MRTLRSAVPAAEAKASKKEPVSAGKTKAKPVKKAVMALKIETYFKGKASVKINEEKPGKGNFVVRVSGKDEPVVELLALKRPFPALKALDMDQVCQDISTACNL